MRFSRFASGATALTTIALMLSTLGLAARTVPARAIAPRPEACAALGNYPVGPRAALQARVTPRQAMQPPPSPWRLAGNIILTSYSGCGQTTAGTFSMQGDLMGTPVAQNSGGMVLLPCALSCLGPPLASVSAKGAFKQDAAHGHDPLYVTIDGTLISVRGTRHSRVTLIHILGYLQVAPGNVARLSFLPPPTLSFLSSQAVSAGTLPLPVVIYGWRGM